ncbi:PulJ/GspJ family protein [Thalassotalea castellviae]|uniref:Prepilin-type N-terminal cleavage/methylation domain-containing protein n=1 Tax=Thalassotalea castellviae TaxID=3075612 RepID=A0ABU2ZY10_9GAMM|nr:prepilin-type N-terminal cleavage/methylation domain-containing protein [Thalassotalea sp. W431]MDT0602815.1 prepilin-type N-terminal cleavage/methylation domain-containing protein [Thalassotalea sp. W431]
MIDKYIVQRSSIKCPIGQSYPIKKFSKNGFTLIEVLVAAVILFASIATVSMVYRGAFLSSEKAEQHVTLSGMMPIILANIKKDIRSLGDSQENELAKQGQVWEVSYQWKAQQVDFKSAPTKLDVDTGDYVTPPLKYKLWLVELAVQYRSTNQQFQFHELSWTND